MQQVVEKRHERSQDKAKFDEKAEFMPINEHFEENFNVVLASAIVFQQPVRGNSGGDKPHPYGNGFNNTGGDKPRPYEGCRFIRQTLQNAKIPRRGGLYALPENRGLSPSGKIK